MKIIFLLSGLIFTSVGFSQELIQGKLLLKDYSTAKFSVYNKSTDETVETDSRGIFKMIMKANDTLVFFHKDIVFDELVVPKHVIEAKALRYFLSKEGVSLDELVIDRTPMFNFGSKKLSKTEKMERGNLIEPVFNNSTGVTLDGVFNRLSGRNNIIKKTVSFEIEDAKFKSFKQVYTDQILIDEYEIPKDYVNSFVYYLVGQDDYNKDAIALTEDFRIYLIATIEKFKKEYEL